MFKAINLSLSEGQKSKRRLIYIPVIHSNIDMGSIADELREAYIKKYGEKRWLEKVNIIENFWKEVKQEIRSMDLDYGRLKIYQDSLPICGNELEIVKKIAREGSENYTFLLELVEKGAVLMGTEHTELLIEEYKRLFNMAGKDQGALEHRADMPDEFITERDKFIAKRIDETLDTGETGIVFIGLIHRLNEFLPGDIEVIFPLTHMREENRGAST